MIKFPKYYIRMRSLNEAKLSAAAQLIEDFAKYAINYPGFNESFFSRLPTDKRPYKINNARRELFWNKELFDSKWALTPVKKEALTKVLAEFGKIKNLEIDLNNIGNNSLNDIELQKKFNMVITKNTHVTVSLNNPYNNALENLLFVMKFPQTLKRSTAFKEGCKVLIVNYMIYYYYILGNIKNTVYANVNNCLFTNNILDVEKWKDFIRWLDVLNSPARKNDKTRGMKPKDFSQCYDIFTNSSLDDMSNTISEYEMSINNIFKFADSGISYVTRDESAHGALKEFKDHLKSIASKNKEILRDHPADILVLNSKILQLPLSISSNIGTGDVKNIAAISLKEHVARFGKATASVLSLRASYTKSDNDSSASAIQINSNAVNGSLDKIRDEYLYKEISKLKSSAMQSDPNVSMVDMFEAMCSKFKFALPGKEFTTVTCKNIVSIDDLDSPSKKLSALSEKAISNLFFTALLTSGSEQTSKEMVTHMLNYAIGSSDVPYSIVKDGIQNPISVDAAYKINANDIVSITAKYAKNGEIKVTKVFIILNVNDNSPLNQITTNKKGKLEIDIRQPYAQGRNTSMEFK